MTIIEQTTLIPEPCVVFGCHGAGWILILVDGKRVGLVCEPCAWLLGDMVEHVPGFAKMHARSDLLDAWIIAPNPTDIYGSVFKRKVTA